jgi:hypothetical protein
MKKNKKKLFFLIIFLLFVFIAPQILAQDLLTDTVGGPLIPTACKGDAKSCELDDFVQLLVNVFQVILGLIGSLAFFFFIYGGFHWILSRGNPYMIQKGKDIIIGSVVGVTVVMASWSIINLIIILLTGGDFTVGGLLFGKSSWWESP